jgi:nitroreductase
MDIVEAIRSRRSIRAFKSNPVPNSILQEILDTCRWAPSGGNAQPWYFLILQGRVLDKVKGRLEEKMETSWDGVAFTNTNPDLPRLSAYPESLAHRVDSVRDMIHGSLFNQGDGTQTRERKVYEHRKKCQRFFEAPTAVVVCSEDANPTALLSIGMIAQTFCLAALAYDLGTCIIGFTVLWPEIYREILSIPEGKHIATSIAVGYPDMGASVNDFPRCRESLDVMVEWHVD